MNPFSFSTLAFPERQDAKQKWKYLNFRFVADFEDSCLTDTKAWLAYVSSIQNESEGGYTYIRSCPISSRADGLIYVFCWHPLTGTLVLQIGTGDVVRIISLQVTHCQNDVRGAGSKDYGKRQSWKKKLLRLLHWLSEHLVEDYLVSISGKTLLQQDKWQFNNFECLESVSLLQSSITVIKATNISSLGTCSDADKIYRIMWAYDLFMAYYTLWLLSCWH